ncbi:glycosyltransferase [Glaciecola sp. HTCC2999]|uniref:glycosyltransferase n=1 Tax=Glaciecola sp. HTCC2999 TaxID=455436 RepID=UPI0000E0F604|nr:glycosyltransferase [Glaciecola sp. HTCC2999]
MTKQLKDRVAIVDPSSYSLPYDFFYINELRYSVHIDFYFSKCNSNYEYINRLKTFKNVTLHEYLISPSSTNKINGLYNYFLMLKDIFLKRNTYKKIHFIWNVFIFFELVLFIVVRDKLIFTFHNDVPHGYRYKVYFPYKVIKIISSKILFVSNYTKANFVLNYGSHKDASVIQHGLLPIDLSLSVNSNVSKPFEYKIIFWGRVEEYKGVDTFLTHIREQPVEIYGKWSSKLDSLKAKLSLLDNIYINDSYLTHSELLDLLSRECVFILPYKDATQSGILYTLLTYGKVFISSNVGENKDFLLKHGLGKLIFDRSDEQSIIDAINYATKEYEIIKLKFKDIRGEYQWSETMDIHKVSNLYDL